MTDDIRRRLEAIEGIDWSQTKKVFEQEYYGDWYEVGTVMVPTDFFTVGDKVPAQDKVDAAQQTAVVEFLTHAADDIRRLLAEQGKLPE